MAAPISKKEPITCCNPRPSKLRLIDIIDLFDQSIADWAEYEKNHPKPPPKITKTKSYYTLNDFLKEQ